MIDFKLVENYREEKDLRYKFNEFTEKIFSGLNFEKWYKSGYWTNNYIPHSLINNDKIISNVSISKMDIIVNGKPIRGIQFGTVGTLPEYRNQGLSKYLMKHVLNKYENSADLFFLYANNTVLDFYTRFGFRREMESIYKLESAIPKPKYSARKLNINNATDFNIIKNLLKERLPVTSVFGAANCTFITMWHLFYVYSKNVYYLEDENIIFIQTFSQNKIYIWDIIFTKPFDLTLILPKVIHHDNIDSILYFFPLDELNVKYDEIIRDKGTMFFVKGNFPLKGKQFKLPTTAQT